MAVAAEAAVKEPGVMRVAGTLDSGVSRRRRRRLTSRVASGSLAADVTQPCRHESRVTALRRSSGDGVG